MDNNEQGGFTTKQISFFTICLVVIIGAIFGYKYYTSTPEYTLKIVIKAIAQNDLNTFNKHVDLHNIIADYYDNAMAYEVNKNTSLSKLERKMTIDYLNDMRESTINEMENDMKNKFTSNNSTNSSKVSKKNISDFFLKRSQQSTQYNGIKSKKFFNKDLCVISLDFYDNDLKDNFLVDLRMQKLADGTWQIIKIDNILDIYKKIPK